MGYVKLPGGILSNYGPFKWTADPKITTPVFLLRVAELCHFFCWPFGHKKPSRIPNVQPCSLNNNSLQISSKNGGMGAL